MIKHELGEHNIKVCSVCAEYYVIVEAQLELSQDNSAIVNDVQAVMDIINSGNEFDNCTD